MHKLDEIDYHLIKLLKNNAKAGTKWLADQVGLSVTPTFERIKRLERIGIIEGYSAKINSNKLGLALKVYCHVSLKSHNLELIEQFETAIIELEAVKHCHHIAGNMDYVLFVEVRDMEAYQYFLRNKLATIPNIANVQSSFVMKGLKE